MKRMSNAKLREAFHSAGLRLTRQRLLICRELANRYDHPDVERIYQSVRMKLKRISLFTVYRTMNVLEQNGLAWRVSTWKGHARYDGNTHVHAHFLCEECGRIDDVDTEGACHEMGDRVKEYLPDRQVRRVEMMIIGTCADCLAATGVPTDTP